MAINAKQLEKSANRIEKQLTSPTVSLILSIASIGASIYLGYLLQSAYRGDPLLYMLVVILEVGLVIQGLLSFWTYLNAQLFWRVDR